MGVQADMSYSVHIMIWVHTCTDFTQDQLEQKHMGFFCEQNFEREYINVLLNKLLLSVIIQIGK